MCFLLFSSGGAVALPMGAMVSKAPSLPGYAVTLTAYNAVPEQTDSDPFVTASGAYSNPEVVAARSRDLADELPFGTIIEVDGTAASKETCGYGIVAPIIGYRVIADTMNARYTDRIDILFSTKSNYVMKDDKVKNAGIVLGICNGITVRVVGHVDINHIPKTQAELATIVGGISKNLALK
jgi:3D (Asp-Asp-Asp) domain-containing protein